MSDSLDMEEEERSEEDDANKEKSLLKQMVREVEMAEASVITLFLRTGNKIRIAQMLQRVSVELSKNPDLAKWYNQNSKEAKDVFESLSKRNDATGYFEYRG